MGMFGDRFSTAMALDNAMLSNAVSIGNLSSYGVGQAAAFYNANMGNPLTASLMQGLSPAMQRQSILDDLQRKHPNPDTPEKLRALASDLSMNGFGDMALTVTNAAIEMEKAEATKAANVISANTPKDTAFSRLTDSLANRVITKDVVHGFLQTSWNDADGDRYGKVGEKFSVENNDNWKRQYDYDYKQAYDQLKGEVENYSIYTQAQNPTKTELNKLLLDPNAQIQGLKAYIEDLGNTTTANYLSSVNILAPTPTSKKRTSQNVEAAPSTVSFSGGIDEDILELLNK